MDSPLFPDKRSRMWPWILLFLGLLLPLCLVAFPTRPSEAANTVAWTETTTAPATTGAFFSVAFGDVNEDGHLDLVGGTFNQGIWVTAGDGSGNWNPMGAITNTGSYNAIALGDLNNDGKVDVAGAEGGKGVRLWTGDGGGNWTEMSSPITGVIAWSVALGDVDNDGNLDLAAGSGGGTGVGVWLGDGSGGWTLANTGLPGSGYYPSLVFGDYNRDGRPDLAGASGRITGGIGDGVRVWTGNGGTSWTLSNNGLPLSGNYFAVDMADLDNDGDLDVVASGQAVGLVAWTGDGAGNWLPSATGLPSGDYWGAAAGDINNDGRIDLAASTILTGTQVWLGDGAGVWTSASSGLPSTGTGYGVDLGDLNDDGLLDLAAGFAAGARAWVDTGTPDVLGGWTQIASPSTTGLHQGVDVGDFNHDGKLDVVAAINGDGLVVWTGNGGNAWTDVAAGAGRDLPTTGIYHTPAFADIDNDGYLDVIASRGADKGIEAWLFINNGWNQVSAGLPTMDEYGDIDVGDFSDDGYVDIVAVAPTVGIRAWQGNGGTLWTSTAAGLPLSGTFFSIGLGDVNRDGYLDIVAGNSASGIRVWQGAGTGWVSRTQPTASGAWREIALGDVNDDGALDIVAAAETGGVSIWAGNGAFGWSSLTGPSTSSKYASLDLGDFNNDGALDLAAGMAENKGLQVWAGNGGTGWSPFNGNLPTTGVYPAVRFGEIDNDGSLDLVGAKYGNGSVHAWTGNEGAPPSGWANFTPSTWVTSHAPMPLSIEVQDTGSGLNPNSAQYSTWEGTTWSAWKPAICSGSPGVTMTQTISALGVVYSADSGPFPHDRNQVRFRIRDMAGNVGTSSNETVLIDATPPTNPDSFPDSSHWPGGGWENTNEIRVENWTGDSDGTSGVNAFSYVFAQTYQLPDTTPETGGVARIATSGSLADGEWYIYMRTRDAAGNWAADASYDGPYRIDTGPPNNPASFTSTPGTGVWTNDNTIHVNWTAGTDAGSGVAGYALHWTTTPIGSVVESINESGTSTTSAALADNNSWYLHLKTADRAGNWTAGAVHWGPFQIDTLPPNSSATSPPSYFLPDFVVHWSGIDGLSGMAAYDVQYQDIYEGGPWLTWLSGTTELTGTFHGEQGHTYAFRSRGIDRAGNVEAYPATADTTTAIAQYEFEAYGLEVTQAVQDMHNSVVLVADKRTYVRFYVRSNALGDRGPVEARLVGHRGTLLGQLLPNNPGGTIIVRETPDRDLLDNSFYFELPADWLHGTIHLEAEVDPDDAFAESDTGNNSWSVDVSFVETPALDYLIVDACYEEGGVTYHAANLHRTMLASWLRRAYPISTLTVRTAAFSPCMDERPSASQSNRILRRNMRDAGEDDDPNVRYYGMIDDGGGFERGKGSFTKHIASGPVGTSDWGWDFDGSYADWYGGHELAHTYDRRHAEFCDAAGGRPYPYTAGNISPVLWSESPEALLGFDVETLDVYPTNSKDIMTYCDDLWMSDFTYEALHDEIVAEGLLASSTQAAQAPAAQSFLEVYGTIITNTDQVSLDAFWITSASWNYFPSSGDYSIRLFDGSGGLLANYPFSPPADHSEQGPMRQEVTRPDHPAAENIQDLDEYVPWVAGTQRIAVYHFEQELASRTVSQHTPVVTLTGPGNGDVIVGDQIPISWQGSDGDGDTLTYWLEYSIDGGLHWQLMSGNLPGSSATLDTSFLPATNQGKFRILASDGVNTGYDETYGTFTIGNKGPQVFITSPIRGASYITGQSVALSAVALDLEDGSLTGTAVSWHSDLAGALGTGELMHVTDLMTGTHIIRVTAMDSHGATATAEVTIFVNVDVQELYLPLIAKK